MNGNDRVNILVSSAGKRVSLVREFQRELRAAFPQGKVFATELNPEMSPAAQISDGCFRVPRVTEPGYADELFRICAENGVRVVVPTIDTELLVLAREKTRFAEAGIFLLVPDEAFVAVCRDKRHTGAFFEKHGIRVPAPIDKFAPTFPLFAKPYDGSLSKDLHVVRSREELTLSIKNLRSICISGAIIASKPSCRASALKSAPAKSTRDAREKIFSPSCCGNALRSFPALSVVFARSFSSMKKRAMSSASKSIRASAAAIR